MAVKFPLKMAGGTMVRTIEELREHFDLTAALAYYKDGRLKKWLENGYYDEEARKVASLDTASDNIAGELCTILGVSYSVSELEQANLGNISNRHERLERLKQYTVDDAILAAVDRVAFAQEELDVLASKCSFTTGSSSVSGSTFTTATSSWSGTLAGSNSIDPRTVIYLCGEHFTIPGDVGGITYVGINSPTVQFDGKTVAAGIDLQGIQCDLEEYIDDYMDGNSEGKRFFDLFADNLTLGMKLLGMAAENGSPKMQTFLGACYGAGRGVEVNFTEAMKWYQKAATQGYASAQLIVANAYRAGSVVQEDPFEAVKWYKEAAEQGITEALVSLVDCYRHGYGRDEDDDSEVVKWYKKAAEQGIVEVHNYLGDWYRYGYGGEQDLSEAMRWYKRAAEQGSSSAQYELGYCYKRKGEKEEAIKWLQKAAEQGYLFAKSELLGFVSQTRRYSKIWGMIHRTADAEIYGIRGRLVWDFIIYNEISFDDSDHHIISLFTSTSGKKTEVEWNRLVNKYGIK